MLRVLLFLTISYGFYSIAGAQVYRGGEVNTQPEPAVNVPRNQPIQFRFSAPLDVSEDIYPVQVQVIYNDGSTQNFSVNEEDAVQSGTDWVITMPTKNNAGPSNPQGPAESQPTDWFINFPTK